MLATSEVLAKGRIFLDLLHIIFTNFLDLKLAYAAGREASVSTEKRMLY